MKDLTEKASIYSAFISGVRDYLATENHDMPGRRSKSADTHRIALSLRPYFPPSLSIDIDTDGADILIHRDDSCPLAVFWCSRYLTAQQRKRIEAFGKEGKATLTLAFTPMHGRDFFLVYRFADDAIDYIHIDKETGAETMLRQRPVYGRKEARQLHLPLKGRKKVTS